MKVKLLNDAGYLACESIEFPVVVEAERYTGNPTRPIVFVSCAELMRVGGDARILEDETLVELVFINDEFEDEFEVIEE